MINYTVINPFPFIYHFRDPQGVCFSIIKGSTLAIVVDTGYGIGPVRKTVEEYIKTPYIVINTHGHMDHSAGNFQFDEVYVPSNDLDLYYLHNSIERRLKNINDALSRNLIDESFDQKAYLNALCPSIKTINVGETIDLGDMHVEIINMEGHTKGSIGLLIKEHKILFTGDAAISMIWLFLKESTDKKTYIKMLENVKSLDFDSFITGHLMEVFDKKFFDYYLEVAKESKPENSVLTTFTNFELPNTYQYAKKFENYNIGICYQEPKED